VTRDDDNGLKFFCEKETEGRTTNR
jgi:hypothetical protein